MKYARLIFAIVSTINIPNSPPQSFEKASDPKYQGGHFWTPITPIQGSILHAGSHKEFSHLATIRPLLDQPAVRGLPE